ncbi:HAL/PAL/TAL family ammonia-lyase [Cereibacter sphaeroides]|uniref:HAL/PAL/TAL family ammonia-lyase n=1 Tax=Cereibacter sphaeroides TaxID=1063 RepID=UPI000191C9EA|nr:aromatic amino acid ammonia-lyase [Cereibacter sphaeroides]ACM03601.1 Histidine ammonia-lyase [Cereibacter sphaeroides KD131]
MLAMSPPKPAVELDRHIDLDQAQSVASGGARIVLAPPARDRCRASEARLGAVIREARHVYGLTTGFGPLANRLVSGENVRTLQANLVHHLASGVGPVLDWTTARAMVLARLVAIAQGASGASEGTIARLIDLLNSELAPAVPMRGTVGASGDLTPLAHMVLCLQGRGDFLDRDGTRLDGAEGLRRGRLQPLDLSHRDALALVNGTSAMTGIALVNTHACRHLGNWAVALTALLAECLGGRTEAWAAALSDLRPHPGQKDAAARLRARVDGSARVVRHVIAERRLGASDIRTEPEAGQDAYSLRCAPQVLGAGFDTLAWHDRVLTIELNAVTDNPVFPPDGSVPALHGGNFMGQHVALTSDALATAVTVLAGLAERQIARLTDERLNRGLPPFLHRGPAGLNSGFMGAQVTATALLAEMRATGPASIHSMSTNAANQDVVSLGTIAARLCREKIDRWAEILGILALCLAQAAELRCGSGLDGVSPAGKKLVQALREQFPPLETDRPLGQEIAALATHLLQQSPV